MRTLRAWTYEMMTRQFLDGLIVGFLCGAMIVTCTALWWAQDRSIVRAARWSGVLLPVNGPPIAESAEEPGRFTFIVAPAPSFPYGQRSPHTPRRVPTSALLAP